MRVNITIEKPEKENRMRRLKAYQEGMEKILGRQETAGRKSTRRKRV